MSEIPYYFDTPVPKYFREAGWFDNENTFKFVTWAFSKCSTQRRKIVFDSKEITLEPFEFICGRNSSSEPCFLTAGGFRNQLISMQKAGLLEKTTNSTTNRFTCYRWVTARFSKDNNQLNNQVTTNSQPTEHHKPDIRTIDIKKPPPNPQTSDLVGGFFECLKEDSRLSEDDKFRIMELGLAEDRVILALEYSKVIPTKTTLLRQVIWHCRLKNPPTAQKSFWDSFREHFKDQKKYNGATCYINCEKITFERGITHLPVFLKEPGSQAKMEKVLEQFGIAWTYDNH